jgi:hypothetical protein
MPFENGLHVGIDSLWADVWMLAASAPNLTVRLETGSDAFVEYVYAEEARLGRELRLIYHVAKFAEPLDRRVNVFNHSQVTGAKQNEELVWGRELRARIDPFVNRRDEVNAVLLCFAVPPRRNREFHSRLSPRMLGAVYGPRLYPLYTTPHTLCGDRKAAALHFFPCFTHLLGVVFKRGEFADLALAARNGARGPQSRNDLNRFDETVSISPIDPPLLSAIVLERCMRRAVQSRVAYFEQRPSDIHERREPAFDDRFKFGELRSFGWQEWRYARRGYGGQLAHSLRTLTFRL